MLPNHLIRKTSMQWEAIGLTGRSKLKSKVMKWATEPQEEDEKEEEEQEDKKKCTREGNNQKGVSEQCWQLKRISRPKVSDISPVGQI